jgi:AcrR family transcriptional regulator
MPKLWNETIETHRHDVREAILDATMALVAEHGPLSVTMSQIAEKTGIGRATLYKYFLDVEAILIAWHERQVADHLASLAELRNHAADPGTRLRAVLEAFALRRHEHHDPDLAALVHRGEHMNRAHQRLIDLVTELLGEAATAGLVRNDIAAAELAVYCVHAISAAAGLPSKAAVQRLVSVTLSGLRPGLRDIGTTARKRRSKKPKGGHEW